ncbi:DUF1566 domain-containing protein [Patescibacteria group bacterium]|nr:DUF1566 domain-containing protein [Patescibacteria group bacterium]
MIGLSGFLSADFTKVADIVTDSKTGLQWQDNNETNSTTHTWQDAIDHCEALGLDGHDDWRLPNINELQSLVDKSKSNSAVKGDTFEYVRSSFYWSSTTVLGYEDNAWGVDFSNGGDDWGNKSHSPYVRCVRAGQ